MTQPLEPARSATPDRSTNAQKLTDALLVLHQMINTVAAQHRVQPKDVVSELQRRIEGNP
jgi:hypothetical protein